MLDLVIKNAMVWIGGQFVKTNVFVKDGLIARIGNEELETKHTLDKSGCFVIPGLIDPHVHFDLDLGSRRSVDDFETGSALAARGGVTTFVDFLAPASTAKELLENYVVRCAEAQDSMVDYTFHATIKNPQGSLEAFVDQMKDLGLDTLKLFTTYSESGRKTSDEDIKTLLKLTKTKRFLLLVHAEKDELIDLNPNFLYQRLPESRPTEAETVEALQLAQFVKETGGDLYMVHVSSGKTVEALMKKYNDLLGTRFFLESCPHYFLFDSDKLFAPDGYLYTMAPPLRSAQEKAILRRHFNEFRTIGTDHCTFMSADKHKDKLKDIPLGVGGIEHSFNVMYHEFGDSCIDKMSKNVAAILRLKNKGEIKVGYAADFAIFQKTPSRVITESHSAADSDIYVGRTVSTKIVATVLSGHVIYEDGRLHYSIGKRIKGFDV